MPLGGRRWRAENDFRHMADRGASSGRPTFGGIILEVSLRVDDDHVSRSRLRFRHRQQVCKRRYTPILRRPSALHEGEEEEEEGAAARAEAERGCADCERIIRDGDTFMTR